MAAARTPSPVSAWPAAMVMATSRWEPASGPLTDSGGIPASASSRSSSTRVPVPNGRRAIRRPGRSAGPLIRPGIALGYQQALLAAPQVDDRGLAAAEQGPGERAVAVAGMVPQVDGRRVGGAAPDPGQAVEAAARPRRSRRTARRGAARCPGRGHRCPPGAAPGARRAAAGPRSRLRLRRGRGGGPETSITPGVGQVPPGPADGRGRGVIPLRGLADAGQLIPARQHPRRNAFRDVAADLEVPRHVPGCYRPGLQCGLASARGRVAAVGSAPFCSSSAAGGSDESRNAPYRARSRRRAGPGPDRSLQQHQHQHHKQQPGQQHGAGATGTLTVFGAGTLSTPFTAELQAFKQQNPGVTIHSQFGASADMVKDITQLGQPADVLGVGGLLADPQAHVRPVQAARHLVRGVRVEPDHLRLHQPQQGRQPAHRVELVQGAGRARRAHRPVQPRRRPVGLPDPADAPARPGLLPRPGPVRRGAEELPGLQRRRDRDLAAGRPAIRPDRLPGHLPVRRAGTAPEVHRAARPDQPVRLGHGRRLRQGHHPRRLARRADRQAHHLRADHPQHRAGRGAGRRSSSASCSARRARPS